MDVVGKEVEGVVVVLEEEVTEVVLGAVEEMVIEVAEEVVIEEVATEEEEEAEVVEEVEVEEAVEEDKGHQIVLMNQCQLLRPSLKLQITTRIEMKKTEVFPENVNNPILKIEEVKVDSRLHEVKVDSQLHNHQKDHSQ